MIDVAGELQQAQRWTLREAPEVDGIEVAFNRTLHGDVRAQIGTDVPTRWYRCNLEGTFNWPDLPEGTEFIECNLVDANFNGKSLVNVSIRGKTGQQQGRTGKFGRIDRMSLAGATAPGLKLLNVQGAEVDCTGARLDGAQFKGSTLPQLKMGGAKGEHVHCCEHTVLDGSNWSGAEVPGICMEQSIARGSDTVFSHMVTAAESGKRQIGGIFWNVDWNGVSCEDTDFRFGHFEGARIENLKVNRNTAFSNATTDERTSIAGTPVVAEQWRGVNLRSGLAVPKQRSSKRRAVQQLSPAAGTVRVRSIDQLQ